MAMMENIKTRVFSIFLLIIGWIGRKICKIYYRGPNKALLPIREQFLMESAQTVAQQIRNKELKSVDLVKACIRRIQEINHITNCIAFTRFDKAIEEAEEIDALLAAGSMTSGMLEKEKPFLGVPFSVKDGISVKGVIRTVGVVAKINDIATQDAAVVALMRKAGAIPIATTNVPEWMNWWDTNNMIFGRTKNPYHSKYCVGGSSGGEAALLTVCGSLIGLGSDRSGSIRTPAFMCGIFGHKPTMGYVDETGHVPQSKLSTMGPLAKKASDLRLILKVLTKNNDELKLDEAVDVKTLRYFYMDNDGGGLYTNGCDSASFEIKAMMKTVVEYFSKEHDIEVEAMEVPPEMKYAPQMCMAANQSPDDDGGMSPFTCIKEMLKGFIGLSDHPCEYTWPVFIASQQAPAYGTRRHKFLMEQAENLKNKLEAILKKDGVLLFPTQPVQPIHHNESLFRPHNRGYTAVFNVTQLPATQCPISKAEYGLPIGLQVVASPKQDRLCFAVAEELEKAFGGWEPPPNV